MGRRSSGSATSSEPASARQRSDTIAALGASAGRTGAAYDGSARRYAALFRDLGFEAAADIAWLRHFVDDVLADFGPEAVVLDAGCGTGRLFAPLRAWGLHGVHGIDASEGMLEQARRLHPDVPVGLASLAALPVRRGSQQAHLAWYSIIHARPDEVEVFASEAARVLCPGGWGLWAFHTGGPDRDSVHRTPDGEPLVMRPHAVPDVVAALDAAGLSVVASGVRARRDDEREAQGFVRFRAV